MTMTDERLAELDAVMAKVRTFPFGSEEWEVAFIPARLAAYNAYPDLKALIDAQAATIARLESELEKTTHPHFWWDVDVSGNGCDDITSILENYEIGEVVELSCARDLPNQWAVGYVTESGGFRGQTFATEAEAVAFAAERAALTGAA